MEFNGLWFLLLVLIGAIIGGGTNIIAIRMLFRPHKAMILGARQLPFTPGLIPKRRSEIANQLGKMVEEHLITPEGVAERIFEKSFVAGIEERLLQLFQTFLANNQTVHEWFQEHMEGQWSTGGVRTSYEVALKKRMLTIINENKHRSFNDLLLDDWKKQLEENIPTLASNLLKKGENYLYSEEGQEQMDAMIARFFETKGSVGGMIGKMFQRVSPSTMLSKELTKFLNDEKTRVLLTTWIEREWNSALTKSPEEYFSAALRDEKVDHFVKAIVDETPIIGEWDQPIKHWAYRYEKVVTELFFPTIIQGISFIAKKHLSSAMKQLGIKNIVRDQVNNFPLKRLEKMLITIASRELKMIAILGALIGGVVGFLQGLLIFVIL